MIIAKLESSSAQQNKNKKTHHKIMEEPILDDLFDLTRKRRLNLVYKSKRDCKDQETIQSSTTPDPGYLMGSNKNSINITNKSLEISPFLAGNEQTRKHEKHKTQKTPMIHKRSTSLEWSVKIFYCTGGLRPASWRQHCKDHV